MDINNIDNIISELISQFDDVTLTKLFLINKKIHNSIVNYLSRKLYDRHKQHGNDITLQSFCYKYLKRVSYGPINIDQHKFIKSLDYDYCCICKLFGKINSGNYSKFCLGRCSFTCCGMVYRMSETLYGLKDYELNCGCYVTHHYRDKKIGNPYVLTCSCKAVIKDTITKCTNCNKIPCNRYYLDVYHESYGQDSQDSEERSYDSEDYESVILQFDENFLNTLQAL
jgi:hypothetical protein